METLYSNWNINPVQDQYHLTTLTPINTINGHTASGCVTPPTPMASDQTMFNFFYQSPNDHYINCNYGENGYYESQISVNYTIPTSMESPVNTSHSSLPASPDLWENYGQQELIKQQQQQTHQPQQQQQLTQQAQQQISCDTSTFNVVHPINTKRSSFKESYRVSHQTKRIVLAHNKADYSHHINTNNHLNYHHHHHHHNPNQQQQPHHRSIEYLSHDKLHLSPEDEERRRRRRERNKVAATKCRNKKKVHVFKLCQESKTLELTNSSLKDEMLFLEREEQRLKELFQKHLPFCCMVTVHNSSNNPSGHL